MTLVSPRREISAALAVLVSAIFIMPSGTAFADEQNTPHPTEIETHTTLPLDSTVEEEPVADDAVQRPEPTETQTLSVEPSQSSTAKAVEQSQSKGPGKASDDSEGSVAKASQNALANTGAPLTCAPGYVYSVDDDGRLYEVNLNNSGNNIRVQLADFGSGSSYNGLGIGAEGTPTYGYQRTSTGGGWGGGPVRNYARILRWNGPGSEPIQVANYQHDLNGSLVAGAVNLNTGDYYFGGYESVSNQYRFRIWCYEPAINNVHYVGYVNTGIRTNQISAANGDMAFNANGDLFFLVSGGSRAAIGTISAEELNGPIGGQLESSSTEVKTLGSGSDDGNANGIAFDADGSIYLGTTSYLYKYNPTTWEQIGQRRNVLANSTDLAGCSSPSSIEITKNVVDRKADADQFRLTLASGNEVVANAITEGSATGQQRQQIGPVPALFGQTYTVRESMASGSGSSMSADYDTTWTCTDHDGWQDSGQGTEFDVAVTKSGQTISCEFTNTPVPDTQLTLVKEFDISFGAPENTDEWTLTATPRGGQTIEFGHNETKNVEAGQYTIGELFGDDMLAPGAAGYELADITCTTDGRDNPVSNGRVTLDNRTATGCVLTNEDRPGTVVWQKTDTDGEHLVGSEWKLTGPEGFGDNGELIVADNGDHDADKRDGYFKVEGLFWGDYELKELTAPDGYRLSDETFRFEITGTDRVHEFAQSFENIAIPTLTLFKDFETSYGAPEDPTKWNLFATRGQQELAFDHGETQQVEPGTYALSETHGATNRAAGDVGYQLHKISCSIDGSEPFELDGDLTIEEDTATECTLINVDLPGAVEWEKTNANWAISMAPRCWSGEQAPTRC